MKFENELLLIQTIDLQGNFSSVDRILMTVLIAIQKFQTN